MLLDESLMAMPVATTDSAAVSASSLANADAANSLAADSALVARIERIVRCRTGGRIRDLRIDLSGDSVVLSGVASTYYAKQLATHAALDEIPGRDLTNAIAVQ